MTTRKKQILIVTALVMLFFLGTVWTVLNFSTGSNKPREVQVTALPTVPEGPSQSFNSRAEQVEQALTSSKEQLNVKLRKQESEIDLDIFNLDQKAKASDPEPSLQKEKISDNQVRSLAKTSVTTSSVIQNPPTQRTLSDPDLIFADQGFGDSGVSTNEVKAITIQTVVHDQLSIAQGSRVTLRVNKDCQVGEGTVSKNTYIHAIARFDQNRVFLQIPPLRTSEGEQINGDFLAYDENDNKPGLYSRELLENKYTSDESRALLNEVDRNNTTGLLGKALKNLADEKLREQTVTLKRNHPVLIIRK